MNYRICRKSDESYVGANEIAEDIVGVKSSIWRTLMLRDNGTLFILGGNCEFMEVPKEGKYRIEVCVDPQGVVLNIAY